LFEDSQRAVKYILHKSPQWPEIRVDCRRNVPAATGFVIARSWFIMKRSYVYAGLTAIAVLTCLLIATVAVTAKTSDQGFQTLSAIASSPGFDQYKLFKGSSYDYMVNLSGNDIILFDKQGRSCDSWKADGNGNGTRGHIWDLAYTYTYDNSTIVINLDEHYYMIYDYCGDFVRESGVNATKAPGWKFDFMITDDNYYSHWNYVVYNLASHSFIKFGLNGYSQDSLGNYGYWTMARSDKNIYFLNGTSEGSKVLTFDDSLNFADEWTVESGDGYYTPKWDVATSKYDIFFIDNRDHQVVRRNSYSYGFDQSGNTDSYTVNPANTAE
jgi:hypothetical protein